MLNRMLVVLGIFLSDPMVLAGLDPTCVKDGDFFTTGWRFDEGKFRDQCVSNETNRPAYIVSEEERQRFGFEQGGLLVANVKDLMGFQIAHLDLEQIEGVYLQVRPFKAGPIPTAHVQLRVSFAKDVPLYHQCKQALSTGISVRHIILSINGTSTVEGDKNVVAAASNHGARAVFGVYTAEEKLRYALEHNTPIHQWRLALDHREAKGLVQHYIAHSVVTGHRLGYQVLAANCGTLLYDFLGEHFKDRATSGSLFHRVFDGLCRLDLAHADRYLQEMGLLGRREPDAANDPALREAIVRVRGDIER